MFVKYEFPASIEIIDGTLIIDFKNLKYDSLYHQIAIKKSHDTNTFIITVKATKKNYTYFYDSKFSALFEYHTNKIEYLSKVKPQYITEVAESYLDWKHFNFFKRKIRLVKKIKKGWVELKEELKATDFTASSFIIIE